MKRLLLIVLPLLLIVGCSKPLDDESLIDRGGVKYQQDSQKPYSGKVFSLYGNAQKEFEGSYKDGKRDGLRTGWYENGQKKSEGTYKDGKQDGTWTLWYENGQKKGNFSIKNGKENGLWTTWYEDGELIISGSFIDGVGDGLFITNTDTIDLTGYGYTQVCLYMGVVDIGLDYLERFQK